MTIDEARKVLDFCIMIMENTNYPINYAAIVEHKNKNDYVVEYGSKSKIIGILDFAIKSSVNYKDLEMNYEDLDEKTTISSTGRLLQKIKERIRPIKAGTSISDSVSVHKSGTLGILLSFEGNPKTYGLTNMHVASSYLSEGEANNILITNNHQDIVQPSKSDGSPLKYDSSSGGFIGKTVWKKFDKKMDVALIEINEREKYTSGLFNYAASDLDPYNYNKLEIGNIGQIQGRTSGNTFGKILSIESAIKIKNVFKKINNGKDYIVLKDQIMTQNIGDPGDSGSVLIANKQVVGLTFADINFKLPKKKCYKNEELKEHGRTFHNKTSNIINAIEMSKIKGENQRLRFYKFNI